jgi:hypothetical protein
MARSGGFGGRSGLVLFLCLALLSGCLPAIHHYHRPSAPSGTPIRDYCATIIGPRESLQLRLDGVELRISGGAASASLRLRVPDGYRVVLASDKATVALGKREERVVLSGFGYFDREQRKSLLVAPGDTLPGADDRLLFSTVPRPAGMVIPFSRSDGGDYVLHLPGLWINGRLHELPPITFTRRRAFGIYLVNC